MKGRIAMEYNDCRRKRRDCSLRQTRFNGLSGRQAIFALLLMSFLTKTSIVIAFRTSTIPTHRTRLSGGELVFVHRGKITSHVSILSSSSRSDRDTSIDENAEIKPNDNKSVKTNKKKMKLKTKEKTVDTLFLLEKLDKQIEYYDGRLPSKMMAQRMIDVSIDSDTKTKIINNDNNNDNQQQHRCGYCGIIGPPNMGKSTILNALLKENLCIATRRPQTTRHAILGVLSSPSKQCCMLDSPGILQGGGAYQLQMNMMEAVKGVFQNSDVLLVVTDLFSTPILDDDLFLRLAQTSKPVLVVVNKIDLEGRARRPVEITTQSNIELKDEQDDDMNNIYVEEEMIEKTYTVEEAVAKWRSLLPNALAIIPLTAMVSKEESLEANTTDEHPGISLLRQILIGCGTNDEHDIPAMVRTLGRPVQGMFRHGVTCLTNDDVKYLLPIGPPLYDDDFLSDRSVRFFCSEFIREALLESRYLKKELPYCCEVQITDYKEPRNDDITRIEATIFVEREGQKAIIIGKNGNVIKQVGIIAREKIERFLDGKKVFLKLDVKVNKDWRKRDDQLAKFGYTN